MLRFLYIMLGFASGTLTGDAAMHLIPHGFENLEELKKGGEGHRLLSVDSPFRFLEEEEHEAEALSEHEKHELYRNIGLTICIGMFFNVFLEHMLVACGLGHSHGIDVFPDNEGNVQSNLVGGKPQAKANQVAP